MSSGSSHRTHPTFWGSDFLINANPSYILVIWYSDNVDQMQYEDIQSQGKTDADGMPVLYVLHFPHPQFNVSASVFLLMTGIFLIEHTEIATSNSFLTSVNLQCSSLKGMLIIINNKALIVIQIPFRGGYSILKACVWKGVFMLILISNN